jgi:hypothetical protein
MTWIIVYIMQGTYKKIDWKNFLTNIQVNPTPSVVTNRNYSSSPPLPPADSLADFLLKISQIYFSKKEDGHFYNSIMPPQILEKESKRADIGR